MKKQLTETDVLEIRRLRQTGIKYRELADRFNVSVNNIGHICTGRNWKHVGGKVNRPLHGAESFWSHVDKSGGPEMLKWETLHHAEGDDSSCWVWTGGKIPDGYGILKSDGTNFMAHRYVWELENGPIPEEMCVCHYCDHPACVRPEHLYLGTHTDYGAYTVQKGHSFAQLYPEKHSRGDRHYLRLHPEKILRGDRHYFRQHPEKVLRGEQTSQAKLTEEQVKEIRRLRQTGMTFQELSEMFNVSHGHISVICSGKGWKHIIRPPFNTGSKEDFKVEKGVPNIQRRKVTDV